MRRLLSRGVDCLRSAAPLLAPRSAEAAALAASRAPAGARLSHVINVVRAVSFATPRQLCALRGGSRASRRVQHRDTPDNNANTPFDFTPANQKTVRGTRCKQP